MDEQRFHYLVANLSAVYGAHVPGPIRSDGRLDDWNVFAPAILARCHHSMESISGLFHREIDAAVLCRSLYDHVVTFAWIAIDPIVNLPRLMKWEWNERRKSADDLAKFEPLRPEWIQGTEAFKAKYVRDDVVPAPGIADRALHAAKAWRDLFNRELPSKYSFQGMYASLFRNYSMYTHTTTLGILPFVFGDPPEVFTGRPAREGNHAASLGPILFGEALLIAGEVLGSPPKEEVFVAFSAALGTENT